jgi:hypothetical protein
MANLLTGLAIFLTAATSSARDLDQLYEKVAFKLGGQSVQLYIADDDSRREQGLMYIEKLPENTGMLFVFEEERPLAFWMKNTLLPLAIGFFDHTGKLVDVQEMSVASSMMSTDIPTYSSRAPAQLALEMNREWFTRHKIKVGSRLELTGKAKSTLLTSLLSKKSAPARQ